MAVETGKQKSKKNRTARIEIQEAKTDSYLSNERTFLNWIRTSLGAFILGFIVARFGLWFDQLSSSNNNIKTYSPDNTMAVAIGIAIIFMGAAMAVVAVYRYRTVNDMIAKGGGEVNTQLTAYVAIAVIVMAVILVIYLLLIFQTFQ